MGITAGSLVSYNDELSIRHQLEEIDGIEGALDGVQLYELLQRLTTETVDLEAGDSKLVVKSKRAKATLKMLELALPISEMAEGDQTYPIDEDFRKNVKLIADICATDMSRPVLTCVHIGDGWIEGSDTYRCARISCPDMEGILIPATSAAKVMDYPVTLMSMSPNKDWLHFSTDTGTVVSARAVNNNYPKLNSMYDMGGSNFTLPENMADALERARVFAYRAHRIDEEIEVNLEPGKITVSASDDNGSFEEVVRWRNTDITARFRINPSFFTMALKRGTNCCVDSSRIKFSGNDWEHVIALR